MISIYDSFILTKVKFKQKKLRFFLTSGALSTGVITISVILMATSGLNSFIQKAGKNSLSDKYIVKEILFLNGNNTEFPTAEQYKVMQSDTNVSRVDIATVINFSGFNESELESMNIELGESLGTGYAIKEVNETYSGYGIKEVNETYSANLIFKDQLYLNDYLIGNYTFEDKYDGAIPILLPVNALLGEQVYELSAKERYLKIKELQSKVVGSKYNISILSTSNVSGNNGIVTPKLVGSKPLDLQVIVVGIKPMDSFLGFADFSSYTISFPNWAYSEDLVSKVSGSLSEVTYYSHFQSKEARDAFANSGNSSLYQYGDVNRSAQLSMAEVSGGAVKWIQRVGYAVGGFFVLISALFVMFTLGKIVSDSRKEIGMFRAVGASKRDIRSIFFIYAFWLIVTGFVMGLFLSALFCMALSMLWGDEIFYSAVTFSTNYSVEKPMFIFLGFAPLKFFIFFLIIFATGLLASYIPANNASKVDPIAALKGE